MGLTERDKQGFRKRSDGKTVLLIVEFSSSGLAMGEITVHELVKEYWEDVGLKVLLKPTEGSLHTARKRSPDHEILAGGMAGTQEMYQYQSGPGWWSWARLWSIWLMAEYDISRGVATLEDFEGGKLPGEEPPEEIKEYFYIRSKRITPEYGSKEYREFFQEIFDFWAKNLLRIGTVGLAPDVFIANKNMRNVPTEYFATAEERNSLNYLLKFLFFKQ